MTCPSMANWIWGVGFLVGWWLLASILFYYTWNMVVGQVFNVKRIQLWGAFLLFATLIVFCAPRHAMRHHKCMMDGKAAEHKMPSEDWER